jgi:hypothetical protein
MKSKKFTMKIVILYCEGYGLQSLNMMIEYELSIVSVPVLPIVSESIHIICSQAPVHLYIEPVL